MRADTFAILVAVFLTSTPDLSAQATNERPRARDAGVIVGVLTPGPLNAITDVAGVRVGHTTIVEGDSVRTGVTAILPHAGNAYLERVPAAVHVANAYGKLVGALQVQELGELETPVLLTCTLCVWRAADALAAWLLEQPDMADVRSINPVVGETNDGGLSYIRARPVDAAHVRAALESAAGGPVAEGSVGAGTGTIAFGWKGGIGTSSRVLPAALGGYTVGVLVQSNFGGVLNIAGAPVGEALERHIFRNDLRPASDTSHSAMAAPRDRHELESGGPPARTPDPSATVSWPAVDSGDGSIMIVVATDAPIDNRNLRRLAERTIAGLARTGAAMTNGSGDFVIAFSTAPELRRHVGAGTTSPAAVLANDAMSPLFLAAIEATEEAIYNSLFRATTATSRFGTAEALPLDRVLEILSEHRLLGSR